MEQTKKGVNHEFLALLEKGLQKSYEKLVTKKAAEGGSLIYYIDGKITEVPAAELLKGIRGAS